MKLDRFREPPGAAAVPLTPLIDVLFLLIIFLVLGANFDQVETLRLPQARGERAGVAEAPAVLRLEMRADGSLWHAGRPLAPDAVLPLLRRRAPGRVLLLPDEAAPVGALIRWYDRIGREAGLPVQVGVRPPAP